MSGKDDAGKELVVIYKAKVNVDKNQVNAKAELKYLKNSSNGGNTTDICAALNHKTYRG